MVEEGEKFFDSRMKNLNNRIKHLNDASETVSFCYSDAIVEQMQKKSDELIDSLRHSVHDKIRRAV